MFWSATGSNSTNGIPEKDGLWPWHTAQRKQREVLEEYAKGPE
jgi:hypothetical protein